VFLAAAAYYVLSSVAHLRPGRIFFAGAIMTLAATLYAFMLPSDPREVPSPS
jgi:hypothetical protein